MSSNRRADASRRKKGIYTRQELIKKHGLATFHPDPEENRKLQETKGKDIDFREQYGCLLYTSPSPRDGLLSRMPSSA